MSVEEDCHEHHQDILEDIRTEMKLGISDFNQSLDSMAFTFKEGAMV